MSVTGQDDFAAGRVTLARQRQGGVPFPLAWSVALGALPPIEGRTAEAVERRQTRDALLSTREAWEAGYERRPLGKAGRELAAIVRPAG